MAYVPVPKDLTKVKTKVAFNFTKRQLICFGGGALVGVSFFILFQRPLGSSSAAMCMILVILSFFLLAMYEKNDQPLETIVGNFLRVCFLRPKQRPYRTNNFYAVLERQNQLDRGCITLSTATSAPHRLFGKKDEPGKAEPSKKSDGKRLSREDKRQIEAAIAMAKHIDKKELSA